MSRRFYLHDLDPVADAELVRRVYARSWPTTCRAEYSADEIIERLGTRDARWWQRKLAASPVKLAGGSLDGLGFALAAPEASGWEFSYLFVEPEAMGTGLAAELHDAVIERLRAVTTACGGWVLEGNERSQRFLTARGWSDCGTQTPPWAERSARFVRFELTL